MEHACRRETCNPQNEPELTNMPLTNCVYLCNYGQVHVCLPDVCTEAVHANRGELVCPISGLVLGVEESLFTRAEPHYSIVRVKPEKKRAKTAAPFASTVKKIKTYAMGVVEKLFYGAPRAEMNAVAARKRRDKCDQKLKTYVSMQKRKREFVSLPHLILLKSNAMLEPLPYEVFAEHDAKWMAACAGCVARTWECLVGAFYGPDDLYKEVRDAPTKPNMEAITLAVLYMMQKGYADIIPYDETVSRHIPHEKDLNLFGYNAKKIKPGKDLVQRFHEKSLSLRLNIQYDLTSNSGYSNYNSNNEHVNSNTEHPNGYVDSNYDYSNNRDVKNGVDNAPDDLFIFKPTVSGHYCHKCRRRFEVQDIYLRHKRICN